MNVLFAILFFVSISLTVNARSYNTDSKITSSSSSSSSSSSVYNSWKDENERKYDHYAYIATKTASDGVHIHWKIKDNHLQLAVIANATGWVGFGIAEAGGMPGSDIVIFISEKDELVDAHALSYATPIVDICQDWELLSSWVDMADHVTIFEAKRALDTKDLQDRVIVDDSSISESPHPIIVAWGDSESYTYHGADNRVSGALRFFQEGESDVAITDETFKESVTSIDLNIDNYEIPSDTTTYQNFCFYENDLPVTFQNITSGHIVGLSFKSDKLSLEYTHHFLLFGRSFENLYFINFCNLFSPILSLQFVFFSTKVLMIQIRHVGKSEV